MIGLIGLAVSTGVVGALVHWALALLVHVDRSTREPVVGLWARELTARGRRVVTGVAYGILLLALAGAVSTLRAFAAWL